MGPTAGAIRSIDQFNSLDESNSEFPFKCILLATSEDKGIIDYFTEFGADLNELTGDTCLLLVLRELQGSAPSYQAPSYQVKGISKVTSVAPFPSSTKNGDAYRVARKLGVGLENLPCLTVFENYQNTIEDLAIVNVPNVAGDPLKEKMRFLVSKMDECKSNPSGQRLRCLKAKIRNEIIISTAKGILREALSDVLSAGTSKLVGLA